MKTDNCRGVLGFLEMRDSRLTPLSREIAVASLELARRSKAPAYGLIIQAGEAHVTEALVGLSFDRVMVCRSAPDAGYIANACAAALIEAVELLCPAVVLLGASDRGKDMAPLAAAHFRSGLTADCTGLDILPDGNLLQIRPAFGGNVMAEIVTPLARPQFATVRGAIFSDIAPEDKATEIIWRDLPAAPANSPVVLERRPLPLAESITEARFLIAIGCGLKQRDDIEAVRGLAESLEGRLASTRGLVERGWMPPSAQIGLSGHSVSPDILLTLGVSGSVQFMAGIGGAKKIIAVNNDPQAGIFSKAHIGFCCDLYEVLAELAAAAK